MSIACVNTNVTTFTGPQVVVKFQFKVVEAVNEGIVEIRTEKNL